jgi:photosystem II stability/assembly factor-like uncharacterized protein
MSDCGLDLKKMVNSWRHKLGRMTTFLFVLASFYAAPSLSQDTFWQQLYSTSVTNPVLSITVSGVDEGVYAGTDHGEILRSDNDGMTWIQADIDSTNGIISLAISPDNTLYAGTYNKGFYRSFDAGMTWAQIPILGNPVATGISICDAGPILAATAYWVMRSDDNGSMWRDVLRSTHVEEYWKLACGPSDQVLAGNVGCLEDLCGELFYSQDSGNTWHAFPDWSIAVYSIAINAKGHFFVGVNGTVVRSTNQGLTWEPPQEYPSTLMGQVRSLAVDPEGNLFAGTTKGVYRSVDEGMSWERYGLEGIETWSLALDKASYLYAGTRWGIHRSLNVTSTVVEDEQGITKQIQIDSVFPNPFTQHVTLTVSVSKPGNIIVKVYDILGREVDTIFDGYLMKGQHRLSWNADGISSGSYWFVVKNDYAFDSEHLIYFD